MSFQNPTRSNEWLDAEKQGLKTIAERLKRTTTFRLKRGVVVHGDCLNVAKKIHKRSVDLVFADPPFNIKYKYDQYGDNLPKLEYLNWTIEWVKACVEVMKPTASMFVAIGDEYCSLVKSALDRYLTMRNWIIWFYKFGVYTQTKFGRNHAHILYYVKDPKSCTFNADSVRVPSLRQSRYKDKRADGKGRVPGDVWEFPRICGTFKERNDFDHKCQMPEAVLERIIKTATRKKEVVFDPFAGSGTTVAVANRLKRRYITCDISEAYVSGVIKRIGK